MPGYAGLSQSASEVFRLRGLCVGEKFSAENDIDHNDGKRNADQNICSGRNTGSASRETILKFLPIEVATYVLEGILLIVMGLPRYFPFADNTTAVFIMIGVSFAIIVVNVILGNKFFPDAKPPQQKNLGPRLK